MVKNLKKGGLYHWRNPESSAYHTIQIPSTAGNASHTLNFETGWKTKILYGCMKVVTDATVADRSLIITYQDKDGNFIYRSAGHTVVTASSTGYINIKPSGASHSDEQSALGISQYGELCLPANIYGLDKIIIQTNNGVAGDAITGFIKCLTIPINQPFPSGE